MIRTEIADYDELQETLARASLVGQPAGRILDLGSGTGETSRAVLRHHPSAHLVGVDSSPDMIEVARKQLPAADFLVGRLEDPLPRGPFDLVVSAFAIHHLDGEGKRQLFRRIAEALAPGGRFVMLDVVVPEEPLAEPIALEDGVDMPSRLGDMVEWLRAAGLAPRVVHTAGDVAIVAAPVAST